MKTGQPQHFAAALLRWFDLDGRRNLPWQRDKSPYRIWVAEIMLQQTQVGTVIPYFERFIERFPEVADLAAADLDSVLHLWSGLGYYARARNLAKAAAIVVERHDGTLPDSMQALQDLPGIGRSTAAAILAQAFNRHEAILDGNVKRVLARYYAVEGWPGERSVSDQLWEYAEELTPRKRVADYTQAIMDLGALLCTRRRPNCLACPVQTGCQANQQQNVEAYPVPKPRRKLPVRAVQMLVVQNDQGAVLLQRRPPVGLWGGLLSFPELPLEENVGNWCRRHIGRVNGLKTQPAFRHTFSHFRLQIHPVFARLKSLKAEVNEDSKWQWFQPGVSTAGLAAPVSALIGQLAT